MAVISRRDRAAAILERLGIGSLLQALPRRRLLIVLNYHRIGDRTSTSFDPGVFSATADELDEQVTYLKKTFRVLSIDEALDAVALPAAFRGCGVLLTFDDGYRDNYTLAFPVLRSHGVQGVFFLVTSFVGSTLIPWWDQIAFVIRQTTREHVRVAAPTPFEASIDANDRAPAIRAAQRVYKSLRTERPGDFVRALGESCGVPLPSSDGRVFLDWDEAAEMLRGGMAIGSHSHDHEILAFQEPERQRKNLRLSRQLLMERLGARVETLAYPVGGPTAFSQETKKAAQEVGFRAAFSYGNALNTVGRIDPYEIHRLSVDGEMSPARFRTRLATSAVMGRPVP